MFIFNTIYHAFYILWLGVRENKSVRKLSKFRVRENKSARKFIRIRYINTVKVDEAIGGLLLSHNDQIIQLVWILSQLQCQWKSWISFMLGGTYLLVPFTLGWLGSISEKRLSWGDFQHPMKPWIILPFWSKTNRQFWSFWPPWNGWFIWNYDKCLDMVLEYVQGITKADVESKLHKKFGKK